MNSRPSPLAVVVCVALAVTAVMSMHDPAGVRDLLHLYFGTPHQKYAAELRLGAVSSTESRAWLESAERSVSNPVPVRPPQQRRIVVAGAAPEASAFVVMVKRGQRFVAEAEIERHETGAP